MSETRDYLLENLDILNFFQIRSLNRYHLHPENKRVCSKCKKIYEGIRENFHIKKYTKSGISYNCNCKLCSNENNRNYRIKIKKDPILYITNMLPSFKNRAKNQNCDFDLTAEYLIDLFYKEQKQLCYYTQEPLSFEFFVKSRSYPHNKMCSLDRLIPSLGYIKGNVVWATYEINRQKNESTEEEFYMICEKIIRVRDLKQKDPIPA